MSDRDQSCESRINKHLESRMEDLRLLWDAWCNGDDDGVEDLGNMYEYGLSFDYVAPDTFNDQEEGYFRHQLSWGGPSDEFRIFAQKVNDYNFSVYRIEYWFLDWFDGASRRLYDSNRELLEEIFDSFFVQSGTANMRLCEAME